MIMRPTGYTPGKTTQGRPRTKLRDCISCLDCSRFGVLV